MKHYTTPLLAVTLLCGAAAGAPAPTIAAVTNVDGQYSKLVAGQRFVLWGTDLRGDVGTWVSVNGVGARTEAVTPNRVDFLVPVEMAVRTGTVTLRVKVDSGPTASLVVGISESAPAPWSCVPGVPWLHQGPPPYSPPAGGCLEDTEVRASVGQDLYIRANAVREWNSGPLGTCTAAVKVGARAAAAVGCSQMYDGSYPLTAWYVRWTMPAGLPFGQHKLTVVVNGRTLTQSSYINWVP